MQHINMYHVCHKLLDIDIEIGKTMSNQLVASKKHFQDPMEI